MVSLEVGIDASGAVSGGAQASSALSGLAQLASLATTQLAGTSAAATAFGTALSAAMPWITAIGAALSGLSAGLLLFSQRTSDAGTEWGRFLEKMERIPAATQAANLFGDASLAQGANQKRVSALFERATNILAAGDKAPSLYVDEFLGDSGIGLGLTQADVIRFLAQQRASRGGIGLTSRQLGDDAYLNQFPGDAFRLNPREQVGLLSSLGEDFNRRVIAGQSPTTGRLGAGSSSSPVYGPNRNDWYAEQQRRRDESASEFADWQANQLRESNEELREMQRLAQQVGQSLADGAFDFLSGISSGKEVLASLSAELGRGILRSLANQLTSELFSTT